MAIKQAGKKWKTPIKVKTKNCYNLTEIDQVLKGTVTQEKYNQYRATLNAIIGGNTQKKVPAIGVIDLGEKEKALLKGVTRLILTKEYIIVYKGERGVKTQLSGLASLEKELQQDVMLPEIRKTIQMLEKVGTPQSIDQVKYIAGIYRDILQTKEKTAPNEKKTMVDVVSSLGLMPNLEEIVYIDSSFHPESLEDKVSIRLQQVCPDLLLRLKELGMQEANREIAGILDLKQKVEKGVVNLSKLQVITMVHKANIETLENCSRILQKTGGLFTEALKAEGVHCKVVYTSVKKKEKVEKGPVIVQAEITKEEVLQEVWGVVRKWDRYAKLLQKGVYYYENANLCEQTLWVKNFTTPVLKGHIEDEFVYLRGLSTSNKMYSKPMPVGAYIDLLMVVTGPEELKEVMYGLHTLKVLTPSYGMDNRHTVQSMGWVLGTEEGLKRLRKDTAEFSIFIDNMIDVLNGVVYCSLGQFLTRFTKLGIQYTARMVDKLKDNEDMPFMYTKEILESANRCFRASKGIARGEEERESTLGEYAGWIRFCISFLNAQAEVTKESEDKVGVQEKVYQQMYLIFEQYNKFLCLE